MGDGHIPRTRQLCRPRRPLARPCLAVYPIHFLMGALKDAGADVTIALSYNMLEAGKVGKLKPKGYFNLMGGVRRIVPRR